jgi:hypothetical protein
MQPKGNQFLLCDTLISIIDEEKFCNKNENQQAITPSPVALTRGHTVGAVLKGMTFANVGGFSIDNANVILICLRNQNVACKKHRNYGILMTA